jgi:hypothetical protein
MEREGYGTSLKEIKTERGSKGTEEGEATIRDIRVYFDSFEEESREFFADIARTECIISLLS